MDIRVGEDAGNNGNSRFSDRRLRFLKALTIKWETIAKKKRDRGKKPASIKSTLELSSP